jgi:glycosyltransferase involved in cell wall biosynthesis
MRCLFVEPFYGGSHRAFLDGLVAHSRHDWTLLTLPEGEWRRRMRRGAQELAGRAPELTGEFDALVVSDMLDLPAFLALTRPRFERTPILAYFHENQMTYPRLRGTKFNSWFGQINYLTALAADAVAFNSEFHREDFLAALRTLEAQPNNWLTAQGIEEIERKSSVLSVGVELGWALRDDFGTRSRKGPVGSSADIDRGADPRTIVWNHRWEFDKAPELFVRALRTLRDRGVPFRLVILGEPGDNPSDAITGIPDEFRDHLLHFGHVQSATEYRAWLARSDIIISTTRHEFFGVGMVEAMAAGCVPCAPNRYNYPALVPRELHAQCLWQDEAGLVDTLEQLLTGPLPARQPLRESALRYSWDSVASVWDEAIEALVRKP